MTKRIINPKPSTRRGKRRNTLKAILGKVHYRNWLKAGHPESDEIKEILDNHKQSS